MPRIYRVKRHAVIQPQDPSYKIIALTQGQNTKVTAADHPWLNQWNWCAHWNKNASSFYVVRWENIKGRRYMIQMAREILGCGPSEEADHKNRDSLDNRRNNLRKATHSQNSSNQGISSDNTSGFKGVRWNKGRWQAYITHKGIFINLGRFDSKQEAALVYDYAARKLHGEFAVLNFPHINSTDQKLPHVDFLICEGVARI